MEILIIIDIDPPNNVLNSLYIWR